MKRKHIIIALIATLIIIVASMQASSYDVQQINVVDRLMDDLSLNEMITISIDHNTDRNFTATLPSNVHDVTVNNENSSGSEVVAYLNCTECTIRISYNLDNAVIRNSDLNYEFYRTLNFPKTPGRMIYHVYLPLGYFLQNSSMSSPSAVPTPTSTLSDGKYIVVTWDESNPTLPKQYYLRYSESEDTESIGFIIAHDIHPFFIWVFVIFLIAGFFLGYFYKKKTHKPIPIVSGSLLSPDEKSVLQCLKKNNAQESPMHQKELGKELNWSKSKVSAVVTNLEYKKLIEREKIGRNYKIRLMSGFD